jgi:hypothetical protein
MRAAFGFLALVVVLAIGLSLGKQQVQAVQAPSQGGRLQATPQGVQQQVQESLDVAAQRASEAQP